METFVGILLVAIVLASIGNIRLFKNTKKTAASAQKLMDGADIRQKEALRDRECAVALMKGAIGHLNGSVSGDFYIHLNECERCRTLFRKHSSKKELN